MIIKELISENTNICKTFLVISNENFLQNNQYTSVRGKLIKISVGKFDGLKY